MYVVAIIVRSRNSSNTHVHSKCLWRFLFFDSFFFLLLLLVKIMILILTPSFLTFFQVRLRCLTSINFSSWLQLTTYAAVVWIYCFFEDIKQFLDLYSKWVKSTLNIYRRSSSSINDRCFCLTVHKSTLVVNEASMERLLNLLPSFYLGYTSHYWILWKKIDWHLHIQSLIESLKLSKSSTYKSEKYS